MSAQRWIKDKPRVTSLTSTECHDTVLPPSTTILTEKAGAYIITSSTTPNKTTVLVVSYSECVSV